MAPKCYICNYYDPKRMSLFRIPNRNDEYSDRGSVWLKLLDEKAENIHKIRICSEHFLKKQPSKADNYLDVDWVPNKNLGKYSNNWKRVVCYIRKKKPSTQPNVINDLYKFHRIPESERTSVNAQEIDYLSGPNTELNECIQVTDCGFNLAIGPVTGSSNVSTGQVRWNLDSANQVTDSDSNSGNGQATASNSLIPLKKRKFNIIKQIFFSPMGMQTELSSNDIDLLFEYYQKSIDERDELLLKLSTSVIDVNLFKDNDKKTRFYTGLTNWKLLSRFFDLVKDFLPSHPNSKLSQFQILVLTLMKLRLNLTFTDLGYRFVVDGTTASRNFHRCLYILFKKFKNSKLIHWPQERKNLFVNTPSYFRSNFKDLVTVIIDCFEIFIERSSMLRAAAQSFSQYKHHQTIKYLIGISMSGAIIFISEAFGGRTSDKEATIKSGFLENLEEGDLVLADKGFLIEDEIKAKKAHLKMPCFVKNGNQLHPIDIESSRKISSLRIHVERVINILRQKFNICADIAQMSAVSKQNDLYDNDLYDKIVFVCSCIVNICPSVVTSEFEI